MYRIRLSRTALAALAVAALASFSTLVASDTAQAGRIDPGFSRGPPRIDPGIGGGPTKVDPGFSRPDSKVGGFQLATKCRWVRTYNLRYRPGIGKACD